MPTPTATDERGLRVNGLVIGTRGGRPVVRGVDLAVLPGQLVALVGESGSGKTTTALACLGYARPGLRIEAGAVTVRGVDVLALSDGGRRALRGRAVAYVPQDPGAALNPSYRVRDHLREALRASSGTATADELLARVRLPADPDFLARYPHQLSGGQQQRVAIAMALAGGADAIILDEPTTGLDTITKSALIAEVRRLCDEGIAAILVTHDLASVSGVADRIAVMYAGSLVEEGPAADVLGRPRHPYTAALIAAVPDVHADTLPLGLDGEPPADGTEGCAFADRCDRAEAACRATVPAFTASSDHGVRCIRPLGADGAGIELPLRPTPVPATATPVLEAVGIRAEHGDRVVVHDGSLAIHPGECLAMVGESGSGKTTFARCLVGLHVPVAGVVRLDGRELPAAAKRRSRADRAAIQVVFQNPNLALNPRITVEDAIGRPLRLLHGEGAAETERQVADLLEQVRLPQRLADRLPFELSGGERQRAAIACALAARPRILVCDEVTSSLDVSVQAVVIDLLADLRAALGLAMLFVTHDLGVVRALADRVVVLKDGGIREEGPVRRVLDAPADDYTRLLVDATPRLRTGAP